MKTGRVGCVLVVESDRLVGIITERDLLQRLVGRGRQPVEALAGEAMTRSPESLRPGDPIAFAVNLMHLGRYRHIPLVDDETGAPVGYISTSDILRHAAESLAQVSPKMKWPRNGG